MKLVVISDTPMVRSDDGRLVVFEPTLREIEALSSLFDHIIWYGYVGDDQQKGASRRPATDIIELCRFPTLKGGKNVLQKLRILIIVPVLTWVIARAMFRGDVIHTRGPSVPAAICIMLSWFFRGKVFWHKYAGDWSQESPPFMYAFQRWMLKRAKHCNVTVNGEWPGQPPHVHAFENPCFTDDELERATRIALSKRFDGPLILCFAGRLTDVKGGTQLLEAVRILQDTESRVFNLVVAGGGPLLDSLKQKARDLGLNVHFTGPVQRKHLNAIYESSHVLILPTRTEGLPKVVAEGAAFGCIPVVTNVSAVGQYVIHGKNGFLLESNTTDSIAKGLSELLHHPNLKAISEQATKLSPAFTYEKFKAKLAGVLGISVK